MSGAMSGALDVLFTDPNIARDALWRVGGAGPGIALRAVVWRPDKVTAFGEAQLVSPTALIDLRIAEAPTIAPGDTLEIDGELLVVSGAPLRDADRLVWTVEALSP